MLACVRCSLKYLKCPTYIEGEMSRCIHQHREITTSAGIGGSVASESALRSAGTLLSRARAPPPAPWLTEGLKA
ncbi:hypothetical protein PoB_002529700 [Plakobranchus ocellatus]|uniref:Uncharacterized protein n=1 Tax=Plakobranchus ocellatus TaxID=259542 RepID=A0AAV3ZUL8_9GAST|nr:hypothetical protein PoB_002529700 [Plakobranchus ocellatus]